MAPLTVTLVADHAATYDLWREKRGIGRMLQRLGRIRSLLASAALASAALAAACSPPASPPGGGAQTTPPPPAAVEAPPAEPITLQITGADGAALVGDPAAGARVYRALCQSCHATVPGVNGTGPSLHGVVDRAAGQVPGFNYSAANRDSGLIWTQEQLFTYLERPQAVMPGTTMVFGGISQPQRRADLIAYLSQQTD